LVKAVFEYTGVGVTDLDRSIKFYTEKLGMQLLGRFKIEETKGETADLKSPGGDQKLELNWYPDRPEFRNGDEVDHLAFRVDDVDKAVAELRFVGVEVVVAPFNEGDSRLAFVKDPDGIWIELDGPLPH
jgi:lactoylglutathione lyase